MSWKCGGTFPTVNIRCSPFTTNNNKIIYHTKYDAESTYQSGIYEYDISTNTHKTLKLWNSINYFPNANTSIYNPISGDVIIVGGWNGKNKQIYTSLLFYNMKTTKTKMIDYGTVIGGGSRLSFTNNGNLLHIIGGTANSKHIVYDLSTNQSKIFHSFKKTNPKLIRHGLIYNKSMNTMIIFGGMSNKTAADYIDFWMINGNDKQSQWKKYETKKKKITKI
eukprot:83262_1